MFSISKILRRYLGYYATKLTYFRYLNHKNIVEIQYGDGIGWLVVFGLNDPLRQYFSLYRVVSQRGRKSLVGWLFWVKRPFETVFQSISGRLPERGRKRRERIDESKNVQTTPTRTYCKRSRPLPYCHPNCRTPRHWKFTQHHRTTPPSSGEREEKG